jgi:hypothetical protein
MTSISSITQQYAKQQQQQKRETQKGGAMFEFLAPSEDEKNKSKDAVPVAPPVAAAPAPAPAPAENQTPDNNEPSVLDKLKDTFGLGDTTPETPTPAAPIEPPVVPVEEDTVSTADKIKGFFGLDSSKNEEAAGEANDAARVSESDAVSVSDSDNAGEFQSEESEESEDDSANEFELIAEKMNTLRQNYDGLKKEHQELKSKMEQEKAELQKKDNSEFARLLAAFFAAEGSLAQLKSSLKTHAVNNGYPIEGLGLDEPVSAPESVVPVEETSVESEEASTPELPPPAVQVPDSTVAPAPAPAPAPEEAVTETETPDDNNVPAPVETETLSETDSVSGSESSLDLEDENLKSTLPEIPVNEVASSGAPVPVPATDTTTAATTIAQPPAPVQEPVNNNSLNGGRNHYIQSTNKKAKTHRHHKRRNRHQTLRAITK